MQTTSKLRSVLKTVGLTALFVALLVLPVLARAGYYYRGWYRAGEIKRPDHASAEAPSVERVSFSDLDLVQGEGRVIIDRAHGNTVQDAELNLLLSRLTARGTEIVSCAEGDFLPAVLRDATALVVIAPHKPFTLAEIQAVDRFVEQGGRVLLVADPGRYGWETRVNEWGEYQVALSDVTAINSLAAQFGLAFSDDYIYNTTENAGNYQYIVLTEFVDDPLTAGLEKVILYAAHSIASGEEILIAADERTTSSLSEQVGGLAVMSLGGDGRVLAVSDLTFMTEPYNSAADNNRLLSNIADFVAGAQRTFGLTEFPRFFGDEVGVVPMLDLDEPKALEVESLEQLAMLKAAFEATGRTGRLWVEQPDVDLVYIGLYGNVEFWPQVAEILSAQGISFTLQTIDLARATPTSTPRWTPTPTPGTQVEAPPTSTPEPLRDWIVFDGVAPVEAKEVALFFHNEQEDRQVLIVLAFSEEGLRDAVKRLVSGDFAGCLIDEDRLADPDVAGLALCPVTYQEPEATSTPTAVDVEPEATPTPSAVSKGSVLVVADDDGQGVYESWTSANDFDRAADDLGYETTLWSTLLDGDVTLEQLQSFDAVIWCTGDYQEAEFNPETEDLSILFTYLGGGGRLVLSGAFIGSPDDNEAGTLLDIRVVQVDHPLARGFDADQVIVLRRVSAEQDYAPFVLQETDEEAIVFVRGPGSEFAGQAVITMDDDLAAKGRVLVIGFPLFLLPDELGDQLAGNVVSWLMEGL